MASTSTNKQPLLVDNVLHNVVNVDQAINNGIDIVGTNTATLLVNAISSDGAIIEDIYAIARGGTAYDVNLYISTANDYLRPNEATFVGTFKSGTGAGTPDANRNLLSLKAHCSHCGKYLLCASVVEPSGRRTEFSTW